MNTSPAIPFDYVLVGGGLQNALIALALLQRSGLRVALVERAASLGGNHVWCFHQGDIPNDLTALVSDLCVKTWPAYEVRFPDLERCVEQTYSAVTSGRIDAAVREAFGQRRDCLLITGQAAVKVTDRQVTLEDGRVLSASVVIAATGPEAIRSSSGLGYQKFVGLELELSAPTGRRIPLLMDARVEQLDGFRFFYVLPFSEARVLIEDTYFSNSPQLDVAACRARVIAYAERNGYAIRNIARQEVGVLPLPTRPLSVTPKTLEQPFLAGFQGGWFHPTTGYSFPVAARLAELVASVSPEALREQAWTEHARAHRKQFRFYAFLNRLLFDGCRPEDRYRVIERFYRLDEPTLRRFYAMKMSLTDRARIFCSKPPRGFSARLAFSGGLSS